MFHCSTVPRNKEDVIVNKIPSSNLSVIVATNAIGMGLDVSNIRFIIF